MLKYSPGDIILISHKNSESVKCLVISIKKRHKFLADNLELDDAEEKRLFGEIHKPQYRAYFK